MSSRATPSTRVRLVLILLLLVAFALRAAALSGHRFHPDEALYATWALTTRTDPALLSVPVDKPPLLIYLLATGNHILGTSEAAFRLPDLLASVIGVALLSRIGWRFYGRNVGLLAAAVYAASPFAIQFAPTAFSDPLLVLWFLAGVLAAIESRPVLGGVALGLAYATKQQAIFLVPLVMAICVLRASHGQVQPGTSAGGRPSRSAGQGARALAAMVLGLLLVGGLVVWWDSLRWHVQPSYWQRSLTSYGGISMAPVGDWGARAGGWLRLLAWVLASPVLNGLVLLGLPVLCWSGMRALVRPRLAEAMSVEARWDLLLGSFVAAYLIAHLVVAVQVWDRYLLPLAPVLCLLCARVVDRLLNGLRRILAARGGWMWSLVGVPGGGHALLRVAVSAALLACLARPAWLGATGQLPVGGDHGAYDGIDVLADGVRDLLPADAVLYYHDLGWHYGYYLHDAGFDLVWYPSPEDLVRLVCSGNKRTRAIAMPAWEDGDAVRQALKLDGLALVRQFAVADLEGHSSFELYFIERAGTGSCEGAAT